MKFRKGDKVLISRVNSGVGDKPWRGVYVKLDKPSDFSRAYGRQAIVDIGGGTITVNMADLRLDKARNPDDEDEPMEEEDDFDLRGEMQEGGVISDGRGGKYNVSLSGKWLADFVDYDKALKLLCQAMEDDKYYPNIFYVNDHGNVDHLWVKPKMRKGKVIKVESKILRSWV